MTTTIEIAPAELDSENDVLATARKQARQTGSQYAGDITPQDAWQLFSRQAAVLIDVRTVEERATVGYVPDSLHVAWATGNPLERNHNFVRELGSKAGKLEVILFLCRSGKRSVAAAEAVSKLGFKNVFNVAEGFEGDGHGSGWLARDLPWSKD
jgi:rhodanese-related sulfurtransferase